MHEIQDTKIYFMLCTQTRFFIIPRRTLRMSILSNIIIVSNRMYKKLAMLCMKAQNQIGFFGGYHCHIDLHYENK